MPRQQLATSGPLAAPTPPPFGRLAAPHIGRHLRDCTNSQMFRFRPFLVARLLLIQICMGITIAAHGWKPLPVFFGDMAAIGWP